MNKHEISTLIHYNYWANWRILALCEALSLDEFIRELTPDPGWGTLRNILAHTLDTELGWRSNLQSIDASVIIDGADFPDVASLKSRWEVEQTAWHNYIAGLSEEALAQGYGDEPQNSPKVWQVIMHVMMHGNQHRAEAAYILTGYGHSPGEIDFGVFLQATGS